MYMIIFFSGIRSGVFPFRPQYAILGTGNLGRIASFERRLQGASQTPLALPYPFRTWPGSGTWAERDKREVRKILYFGRYTPELFLDLGIYMQSFQLNEKQIWENIYFQVGIISKLASYFVLTTLFSWLQLEAFGVLSYDCCVVAFRHRISRLKPFVQAFVVFEGGVPYPTTSLQLVSVLILHSREIQLIIIMWSQTVRQSKPNNRN